MEMSNPNYEQSNRRKKDIAIACLEH